MKKDDQQNLTNLIKKGNLKNAIANLLSLELDADQRKEAQAISYRYNELKRKQRAGILSFEQAKTSENQIVHSLIEFICMDDEEISLLKKPGIQNEPKREKRSVGYIIGIVGSLASIIALVLYFFPFESKHPKIEEPKVEQLTVFVTDEKWNIVLENEGRLNIPIGNRSLNQPIGYNGRTNFPDITANNIGDSITIGLEADGWEIKGTNQFLFEGKPLELVVKRDNSLGIIKGSVKTQIGQNLIDSAKITITNANFILYSDTNGLFDIILPENKRVKSLSMPYNLNISKKGFKTKTLHYFANTSDMEILLEKSKP